MNIQDIITTCYTLDIQQTINLLSFKATCIRFIPKNILKNTKLLMYQINELQIIDHLKAANRTERPK